MELLQSVINEVRSWAEMDIMALIQSHGPYFYLITFVWTFLEGETFVIFAGAATTLGHLNFYGLVAVAWLGSFCGDQLYFWIGRHWGAKLLHRFPRWEPGVQSALHLLEKYHIGFILSFRFIYGVRNFSSFAMGISDLHWARFVTLNFIAAGIWAVMFAGAGYMIGGAVSKYANNFGVIMLGVFVCVFILLSILHRRSKKSMEAAQAARTAAKAAAEAVDGQRKSEEIAS